MTSAQAAQLLNLLNNLPGRIAASLAAQLLHQQQQQQPGGGGQGQGQGQPGGPGGSPPPSKPRSAPYLKKALGGRGYRQFGAGRELAHAAAGIGIPGAGGLAGILDSIVAKFEAVERFMKALERFNKAFNLKGGRKRKPGVGGWGWGSGGMGSGGSGGGPGGGGGGAGAGSGGAGGDADTDNDNGPPKPSPNLPPIPLRPPGSVWKNGRWQPIHRTFGKGSVVGALLRRTRKPNAGAHKFDPPETGEATAEAPTPTTPPKVGSGSRPAGPSLVEYTTQQRRTYRQRRADRVASATAAEAEFAEFPHKVSPPKLRPISPTVGGGASREMDAAKEIAALGEKLDKLIELQKEANDKRKEEQADHGPPVPGSSGDKGKHQQQGGMAVRVVQKAMSQAKQPGGGLDVGTILQLVKLLA